MKINVNKEAPRIFTTLSKGTVFYSNDISEYCMKIELIQDASGDWFNAICLETGELHYSDGCDEVATGNAELNVDF